VKILVGDVGGTFTRLALFDGAVEEPEVFPTDPSLPPEELIDTFLAARGERVESAVLGVAAAVRNGRCMETTNLPWPIDARRIARAARVERALLVNDVEVCAHGIAVLEPGGLATLNAGGTEAPGNRVVISLGTGLGQAGLYWDGERHHAFASEGGYADFAPRNELEAGLGAWLADRYDHVSYERACSGSALGDIHHFLSGEVAPSNEISGRALGMMLSILGTFAGSAALNFLATGRVYLAGGIPRRVLPQLEAGGFLRAFADKGLLRSVLERIPVHVILNEWVTLLGAGVLARQQPN